MDHLNYAQEFSQIVPTLARNQKLREHVLHLIGTAPIPGKATEGGSRLVCFRKILVDVVEGKQSLVEAYREVEVSLPRATSPHAANNRVFPQGWAERLVRTQLNRFYSQAVLEEQLGRGITRCFVPHSSEEQANSECSMHLAGKTHDAQTLLQLLVRSYGDGEFIRDLKIPHHPHCTHVVIPVE